MTTNSYTQLRRFLPLAAAACMAAALPALADSDRGRGHDIRKVRAELIGYEEVPTVSSPGSGLFKARIDKRSQTIEYELSYEDTQGTVFMAHIHAGQRGVNGGIVVWLCGNPADGGTPPVAGVPACPVPGGTVFGTITAGLITPNAGAQAQLFSPGDFEELVDAIRAGVTYVNVHTTAASGGVPGGEIRGQVK